MPGARGQGQPERKKKALQKGTSRQSIILPDSRRFCGGKGGMTSKPKASDKAAVGGWDGCNLQNGFGRLAWGMHLAYTSSLSYNNT